MSSSSSSASHSPSPPPKNKKKVKGADKKKSPSKAGHGTNEGTDPDWAYAPPAGTVPLQNLVNSEEFEWDNINEEDDCELWLIRVPDGVRPLFL